MKKMGKRNNFYLSFWFTVGSIIQCKFSEKKRGIKIWFLFKYHHKMVMPELLVLQNLMEASLDLNLALHFLLFLLFFWLSPTHDIGTKVGLLIGYMHLISISIISIIIMLFTWVSIDLRYQNLFPLVFFDVYHPRISAIWLHRHLFL